MKKEFWSTQAFLFFHEKVFQPRLKSINIDYVIESTGKYNTYEQLNTHIVVGAARK
jgi:glyceraldehyde 3-phosphate dehydrogenase